MLRKSKDITVRLLCSLFDTSIMSQMVERVYEMVLFFNKSWPFFYLLLYLMFVAADFFDCSTWFCSFQYFLSPFLYMTEMIPILEVTPTVQSYYPRSHKHLKGQELVHRKRVYKIQL